jgi:hypothetical protein
MALAQSVLVVDNPAERVAPEAGIKIDLFAATDHVPISAFDDDPWPNNYRSRSGTNISVLSGRAAIGGTISAFSIDYLARSDWLLRAGGDTAHFLYFSQTDQLISSGRQLAVNYDFLGVDLDGLRLGFAAALPHIFRGGTTRLGFAGNYLRGLRLHSERASATYRSDGTSASLNGQRELWSTELQPSGDSGSISAFIPYRSQSVPSNGEGYSFDLGVTHRTDGGISFGISANDIGGVLHWEGVPHISQNITINNVSTTNYTASATPAVSGYNDYRDLRQKLPTKYKAALTVPAIHNFNAFGEVTNVAGNNFPVAGISWTPQSDRMLFLSIDTRWKSISIGGRWESLLLSIRSDKSDISDARAIGLQMSLNHSM